MKALRIQLLGELTVFRGERPIPLPSSRKARALLAYLALTARPHRRDRLCELLWELPDDPRGALRWALSKLRAIVNDEEAERIAADRERAAFVTAGASIDLHRIAEQLDHTLAEQPLDTLCALDKALRDPLLDGIDLPNQQEFQAWLEAERQQVQRLRARIAGALAQHPESSPEDAAEAALRWLEFDAFSPSAASAAVSLLRRIGRMAQADGLADTLSARMRAAGVPWQVPTSPAADTLSSSLQTPTAEDEQRAFLGRQTIHFCTAHDEVRIAYATVGEGTPVVKAANWLSHLELDWNAPIWSPLFRRLARHHRFVRYDERGNGLSDWDVESIDFDAFVTDLETVVDALDIERFALLGISQGASVSIEYAVRHPERVSHLILFGAYAAGWRVDADEVTVREREAVMTLTASGWGKDLPTYRQIFSSTFMPSATAQELAWFNEFQRQTASPENAVRFLSAFGDIDVRHRLGEVRTPTLVLHSRGDQRIPVETGRHIAARIPGAEFVSLESDGHLLLGREPASERFLNEVNDFLER
ncbi:MAG: alpha/beta fold hydrolase [Pseudomonadota bacterium]